jgi:hypothetical protein
MQGRSMPAFLQERRISGDGSEMPFGRSSYERGHLAFDHVIATAASERLAGAARGDSLHHFRQSVD